MIRINLLPRAPKGWISFRVDLGRAPTILAGVLLVEALAMGGWWVYAHAQLTRLQGDMNRLRAEEVRLNLLLVEANRIQQLKQGLKRRLDIIAQLEKSQGVPVGMMEGILQSLPQGLWLTALDVKPVIQKQEVKEREPGVLERLSKAEERASPVEKPPPGAPPQPPGPGQPAQPQAPKMITILLGYQVTLQGQAMSNLLLADFLENLRRVPLFRDVDLFLSQQAEVEQVKVMNFTLTYGIRI